MRRFLVTAFVMALLGYGAAACYLKVNETDLVFKPAERRVQPPDASWKLRHREVSYPSADGVRLNAWIMPAAEPDSTGFWLLICHGNYGNIGFGERPEFYSYARDIGLNLFAFDYRGFGNSEGEPTELGLYDDAVASYRFLTDSLNVPPDRIIIFGHSLGSGVATELATRVTAAALVVEGGFTSVPDRGQELYPFLPVKLIATERFESIAKVGRITIPKLYLHSPSDDVIPLSHGERVFAAAAEPKRFVKVAGGHMHAFRQDRDAYFGAIKSLMNELPPPAQTDGSR
jgi:hypothetical protein